MLTDGLHVLLLSKSGVLKLFPSSWLRLSSNFRFTPYLAQWLRRWAWHNDIQFKTLGYLSGILFIGMELHRRQTVMLFSFGLLTFHLHWVSVPKAELSCLVPLIYNTNLTTCWLLRNNIVRQLLTLSFRKCQDTSWFYKQEQCSNVSSVLIVPTKQLSFTAQFL